MGPGSYLAGQCLFGEGICTPVAVCGTQCRYAARARGPYALMVIDETPGVRALAGRISAGQVTEEEAAGQLMSLWGELCAIPGRLAESRPEPAGPVLAEGDAVVFRDSTPPRREWVITEFDGSDRKPTAMIRRGSTVKHGVSLSRLVRAGDQEGK